MDEQETRIALKRICVCADEKGNINYEGEGSGCLGRLVGETVFITYNFFPCSDAIARYLEFRAGLEDINVPIIEHIEASEVEHLKGKYADSYAVFILETKKRLQLYAKRFTDLADRLEELDLD